MDDKELVFKGAQQLGYQPTTLYKINRAACHALAERSTAYRRELREKRLQGYREEIRQIALRLQAGQVALTQRHISRYLAQPAILRDPKVRELLWKVCRELEISDGRNHIKACKTYQTISQCRLYRSFALSVCEFCARGKGSMHEPGSVFTERGCKRTC